MLRKGEKKQLEIRLRNLIRKEGGVVIIEGSAGMGKTALMQYVPTILMSTSLLTHMQLQQFVQSDLSLMFVQDFYSPCSELHKNSPLYLWRQGPSNRARLAC